MDEPQSHEPQSHEPQSREPRSVGSNPNRGAWIELGITALATVGLLTLVIGGSILVRNAMTEDERRERIVRVQPEPDEPEQYCYEEVTPRNGGLFGDRDDQGADFGQDDFDAEARFADAGERRVIIVCEDW